MTIKLIWAALNAAQCAYTLISISFDRDTGSACNLCQRTLTEIHSFTPTWRQVLYAIDDIVKRQTGDALTHNNFLLDGAMTVEPIYLLLSHSYLYKSMNSSVTVWFCSPHNVNRSSVGDRFSSFACLRIFCGRQISIALEMHSVGKIDAGNKIYSIITKSVLC